MARPIVRFKPLVQGARHPEYAHEGDSGADLYSVADVDLLPMGRAAIPTGIAVEVPVGYELQVRPKSGLALAHGVTVLNAPGTIDACYRGEIAVILANFGSETFRVTRGQKIAQLVLAPIRRAVFEEADVLSATTRGAGGFGSTGER
jgi:dUTP pyrophosphatase